MVVHWQKSESQGIEKVLFVSKSFVCAYFQPSRALAYILWFAVLCFYGISVCVQMWMPLCLYMFFVLFFDSVFFPCLFISYYTDSLAFILLYLSSSLLRCLVSNEIKKRNKTGVGEVVERIWEKLGKGISTMKT